MARRRGFFATLEHERKLKEREQKRHEAAQRRYAREQKAAYVAARKDDAVRRTAGVAERLNHLNRLLLDALAVKHAVNFDALCPATGPVDPDSPHPGYPNPPSRGGYLAGLEPGFMERLFGWGRQARERRVREAEAAFAAAQTAYEQWVARARAWEEWNERLRVERRAKIEVLRRGYVAGEQQAVEEYCTLVIERSDYPIELPSEFDLLYEPESKELVIQFELPKLDIIPEAREFRYVQSGDRFTEVAIKPKERTALYELVVAQLALRTIHELFDGDQAHQLASVVFNGIVRTIDPQTGQDVAPCLVTVQAEKAAFQRLDLMRVDPVACLKGLRAHVSPAPGELAPVKPIVSFDMVDRRFVQEQDVLSGLDDRTNLLEMNPFDFEHLICNLFSKIGLEAKLTRASRDGGIDVVAFDPRPVFGGKYVIQAKRYRNTVGVEAVRDLYGSMMNENAAKGMLVTTSSYGPDARSFAKDKPIELIDGRQLLHMLEEHGVRAKIVAPDS